jgi:hypothetical protein
MIKHVGRHNNKKVAIVFKQVPDEDHMALVVYTESIPSRLHDEMMTVIESAIGQNAKDLGDALFRHTMADGDNCLTAIHKGGYMKKVPTIQVIVTPTSTSSCRLDELNDILRKMEGGEDAVKKLAELDASQGMRGGKEVGEPTKTTSASVNTTSSDVLSDADIAKQRLEQASRMEAEANSLLAEAKRLKEEAKSLAPAKKTNVRKTATKKATA